MIQAQIIQGFMKKFVYSGHKKTNPIQTQFNPKQTQFKPNQSQFVERGKREKNESFCVDKQLYNDIRNATRGF